eukprot:scaffold19.g1826.t1
MRKQQLFQDLTPAQQQPQQQAPPAFAVAPSPPPPPLGPASHKSQTQQLYTVTDEPIISFGFTGGFEDKYKLEKEIGRGTFGVVYICRSKATGERFAVKRMKKKFQGAHLEQYFTRRVVNEVDIGRHLSGSLSICSLHDVFEDGEKVDLVMELCTGGQLWDRIKAGSYTERAAARLMRDIMRAIAQCHGLHVLLRDVKPENFMFLGSDEDSPLKARAGGDGAWSMWQWGVGPLCVLVVGGWAIDFGIAVFCQPGQYIDVRAGTPIYIAPEVLKMRYTLSADIWSAGIIAYQLLSGRLPFAGEEGAAVAELYMEKQVFNSKDVFRVVLYSHLDFESHPWESVSPEAKDFVQSLLQRDEKLRPTAEQALAHPWLREDWEGGPAADVPLSDTILDVQGTGRVSRCDVRAALLESGQFNLSSVEADQLLEQLDIDHNGEIDVDEFLAAMVDWSEVRSTRDWDRLMTDIFKSIDQGDDGALGPEDLERLLCGEEGCAFPDEVDAALREADTDHDRVVSLDEFKAFLGAAQDDALELFDARLRSSGSGSSGSGSDGEGGSGRRRR